MRITIEMPILNDVVLDFVHFIGSKQSKVTIVTLYLQSHRG